MTQLETETIDLEMSVAARPATVFALLATGEGMARWFGSTVELDPRPGGALRVDINGRDIAAGELVEIVPNERVVFTFGWEGKDHPVPAGSTTVEITLSGEGNRTVVRLRHTGLSVEAAAQHKEGWQHYYERLQTVAEGGDPGPDSFAE